MDIFRMKFKTRWLSLMIVEIALMLNFQTLAMKSYEGYRIFSFPVSNEIQQEALRKLVKSVRIF